MANNLTHEQAAQLRGWLRDEVNWLHIENVSPTYAEAALYASEQLAFHITAANLSGVVAKLGLTWPRSRKPEPTVDERLASIEEKLNNSKANARTFAATLDEHFGSSAEVLDAINKRLTAIENRLPPDTSFMNELKTNTLQALPVDTSAIMSPMDRLKEIDAKGYRTMSEVDEIRRMEGEPPFTEIVDGESKEVFPENGEAEC